MKKIITYVPLGFFPVFTAIVPTKFKALSGKGPRLKNPNRAYVCGGEGSGRKVLSHKQNKNIYIKKKNHRHVVGKTAKNPIISHEQL